MKRKMRMSMIGGLLCALGAAAGADVISPEEEALQDRLRQSTVVDRVDQYCADKRPGDACTLPGNAFEGGGPGRCRREANPALRRIELSCRLRQTPEIDRQLPASAEFVASPQFCRMRDDEQVAALLARSPISCDAPATLPADRFCRDLKAGDACSVEAVVAGKQEVFAGRCAVTEEARSFYQYGHNEARRQYLSCQPATPAPEHRYQRRGFVRNLLQRKGG